MKPIHLIAAILPMAFGSFAQQPGQEPAQDPVQGVPGVATKRAVVNFAELARQAAPPLAAAPKVGHAAPAEFMPASMGGTPPSPAPADSFQAFDSAGNPNNVPDTFGAVGPNHLMATVNGFVRIQDRSGAVLGTLSENDFWGAAGHSNVCCDMRELYEPYDHRWVACALPVEFGDTLLVGVSQTEDPTGNWNVYRVVLDTNTALYSDYPEIGFNKDWIVVQCSIRQTSPQGGTTATLLRSEIFVFNKTNLYAGGEGLFTLFKRSDLNYVQAPATTYDPDLATMYLLGSGGTGTSVNSVRLYTINGPVGSETFVPGPIISATNRWDYTAAPGFAPTGYFADLLPQLGSPQRFTGYGADFYSMVYRNGSLWAAHHVYLPAGGAATHTAVQWWQLSPAGELIQRGLLDDPSGRISYAFPSLSVNKFNDVLVGYSRFATNQYVSANYAFRAGNDSPNTLRADTVLKAGEAPFSNMHNWDDYTATVVDPANDVDLWTIQEFAATPSGGVDGWGTWWGRVVPPNLNLGIRGATVTEGDSGSTNAIFILTLSKTNDQMISVDFATADGSALARLDYIGTNGTLVFNPGETNKAIPVQIIPNSLDNPDKTFFLNLSNPTNIVLAFTQALGTIIDDDFPLGISNATVNEGNTGTTNAAFTLSLSKTNERVISVDFVTADGSAIAGLDFIGTNGTVVFNPGQTNQTISIQIISNTLDNSNKTFFVNFSNPINISLISTQALGTILDDDPPPAITINDISVLEGDTGATSATFTLSLSAPSSLTVSVRCSTGNLTATALIDYVPTNILVIIPPGATSQTFAIQVIGDTMVESNETFFVALSSRTNATLARTRGNATILDDDFKVTVIELTGGDVRLRFATGTNQTYRVERTQSLAAPIVWEPVDGATNVLGTGAILHVTDTGAFDRPQRFYRVRLN